MKLLQYFLVALLLLPSLGFAETTFEGKVTRIIDGDDLVVTDANDKKRKVRLMNIDAPEAIQSFGRESMLNLKKLCLHKSVVVHDSKKRSYNRIVGVVKCDGKDANFEQVKAGFAWVYKKYTNDKDFIKAEENARNNKLGLWQDKYPTAPWEHRKSKRKQKKSN